MTAPLNSITFDQAASRWLYEPHTGLLRLRATGEITGGSCTITLGYRKVAGFGRSWAAHRIAWLLATGEWPRFEIDHINGVRWDNRLANLRDVPHHVNQLNQSHHRGGPSHGEKIRKSKAATRAAIARITAEQAARRVTEKLIRVTNLRRNVTSIVVTASRAHALSEGRSQRHSDVTRCVCDWCRHNPTQTGSLRDPSAKDSK